MLGNSLVNNNGDNSSIGQFQPTKTDFLCSNKITLIKKVIKRLSMHGSRDPLSTMPLLEGRNLKATIYEYVQENTDS